MGMGTQNAGQELDDDAASAIESANFKPAAPANELDGGRDAGEIPPGVAFGILVPRGKVDAALSVQLCEKFLETAGIGNLGGLAGDGDAVRSGVAQLRHGRGADGI